MTSKNKDYERVSIALLNWNNADDTLECLESLKKVQYPHFDVVLVDNGSEDNSIQRLEAFSAANPNLKITILKNAANFGFAGGNNTAIEWAVKEDTDYLLLLNNDTVVDPLFLDELVREASPNKKAGVAVPAIHFYYEPQLLWFGGDTNVAWAKMNRGITCSLFKKELGEQEKARPITFATGCAMMFRVEALKEVGGFDDRFFLYFEDADLSFRMRKAGWDILWVPSSRIFHKVSATTLTKVGSPRVHYYDTRNILLLAGKHGPRWMVLFAPVWALFTLAKQGIKILVKRNEQVSRAIADGILDYYGRRFGKYRK